MPAGQSFAVEPAKKPRSQLPLLASNTATMLSLKPSGEKASLATLKELALLITTTPLFPPEETAISLMIS